MDPDSMADGVPRLRMFAGPNGSGKSTLKAVVRPDQLGHYVNADEIESALGADEGLDLSIYGIEPDAIRLREFLGSHGLIERAGLFRQSADVVFDGTRLRFRVVGGNSYFAAAVAAYVRRRLIERRATFSFETVMSSRDKVELLKEARGLGYRTYLYYIATEDPEINVSRVENRVRMGGHDVPRDKVVSRYARSLSLLPEAIHRADRAYVFDNSAQGAEHRWIAEFSEGANFRLRGERVPEWFRLVILNDLD